MRLRATPFVLSSATPRLVLDGRRRHADFGELAQVRMHSMAQNNQKMVQTGALRCSRTQLGWLAGNLTHYRKEEPLQGVVNPSRGY